MKLISVIILLMVMHGVYANSLYPLPTARQTAQFDHLIKDLRCLVCQNQNLADSQASLADDLRLQVYDRVKEGQSDSEIINYLTSRYGDFILFNPPVKGVTLILWWAPVGFLIIGLIIWRLCLKRFANE